MRRAAPLVCAALAACVQPPADEERGNGAASANAAGPEIRMANEYHDRLAALPPFQQRLAMMRAVRATGNRCQRVANTGYQQDYRNLRMWIAVCDVESKSFAVYLAPNGDVQVRDCADLGQLGLPRCEGLPPPVPDANAPQIKEGAADNAFRPRPPQPTVPK